MAEHTPGEWVVQPKLENSYHWLVVAAIDQAGNARPLFGSLEPTMERGLKTQQADEIMANTRLIASAPDLLSALEELLEVATLRGDNCLGNPADDPKLWTARMQTAWDEAELVRAKARGE